jgi:hypothetical protein
MRVSLKEEHGTATRHFCCDSLLGQIAGVDAIVTGTLTPFGDTVRLTLKVLDTATARIVAATTVEIPKTKAIEELVARGVGDARSSPPQPERQKPRPAAFEPIRVRVNDHVFELKRCTRSGESLQCEILITNEGADRKVYLFASSARLIDEGGTEFQAISLTFSGGSSTKVMVFGNNKPPSAANLASGVPVKAVVSFEGIPSSTQRATLIEIQEAAGGFYGGRGLKAQFRNVPLSAP